jgi:hypothetical protein
MDRPPAQLVAEVAAAIEAERVAICALRVARGRVVEAMKALRVAGIPLTAAALPRALGLPPTIAARRRLAHRLRQRTYRVTHRDALLPDRSGPSPAPSLRSENKEEAIMTQLIRRKTVTEDYLTEDGEEIDIEPDADEEGDEETEEESESKRTRRTAKRRQ